MVVSEKLKEQKSTEVKNSPVLIFSRKEFARAKKRKKQKRAEREEMDEDEKRAEEMSDLFSLGMGEKGKKKETRVRKGTDV